MNGNEGFRVGIDHPSADDRSRVVPIPDSRGGRGVRDHRGGDAITVVVAAVSGDLKM